MRHRRRALSYMFRQFALASSSVQRLVVITVRDLATTVGTGFTAAMHTGAVVTIAGTNQRLCRGDCISRHIRESDAASLKDSRAPLPF